MGFKILNMFHKNVPYIFFQNTFGDVQSAPNYQSVEQLDLRQRQYPVRLSLVSVTLMLIYIPFLIFGYLSPQDVSVYHSLYSQVFYDLWFIDQGLQTMIYTGRHQSMSKAAITMTWCFYFRRPVNKWILCN